MEDALAAGHPGVVSAYAGTPKLKELVCKISEACSRNKESLFCCVFFFFVFLWKVSHN